MLRQIHFDKDSSNADEEDDSEVVIMVENKQILEEHVYLRHQLTKYLKTDVLP